MPELRSGRTQRLRVDGMKCTQCVDKVEQTLRALGGVENVNVDLSSGTATVIGNVEPEDLINALSYTDYQARPLRED